MQYHYIYKITLLLGELKGYYYYGKRSTDAKRDVKPEEDTNYTGSGNIVRNYFKKYKGIKQEGVTHIKEIIEENPDKYSNAAREKEIIGDLYETDPLCLNRIKGGWGGGWFLPGHSVSEETRRKISEAGKGRPSWNKGKPMSEEQKAKLSEATKKAMQSEELRQRLSEIKKGKSPHKWTEESLKKLSASRKGFKMSEEQKRKLSESHKGQTSGMKGKHHTEEAKRKLSEARKGQTPWIKGKHHTDEARKKMSDALNLSYQNGRTVWNKGIPWSEEAKQKMSEARKGIASPMKGRKHTEETKRKLSENKKGKTVETNPQNISVMVLNTKNGETYEFISIGQAARELKLNRSNIVLRLKENPNGVQIKEYYFQYKEKAA